MRLKIRSKDGKGILVERDGTKYTRKASAEQRSPKVKAIQGCIKAKTEGKSAESREEWQEIFKEKAKECKEEID